MSFVTAISGNDRVTVNIKRAINESIYVEMQHVLICFFNKCALLVDIFKRNMCIYSDQKIRSQSFVL